MSPGVRTREADALEQARCIHAEELVADSRAPTVTCLLRRGIPVADVVKIAGRNFLRVFREVRG